jgi:hypothetical protein
VISDARRGTQGQAAARGRAGVELVRRSRRDGSGIARRREGFWFRDQGKEREELGAEAHNQLREAVGGLLENARAWERSLPALAARDDSKFEASFALSLSGVQATRLPLQALSRVKGCASRGGESGVEHDHDYEHEHEHKEEIL